MNIEFKISKKPVVYDKAIRFLEKRVEKVDVDEVKITKRRNVLLQ